ncbi:Integrase catalytic core [Arabidopsis suecica]|uniref:Integrase catalytic core n=1 Tax=Arabidopsis suecica TaxID=45249 RepID=A0A8T1ZU83_ARASU|nr:Integrase catalytic core [Arabidopsis suecica]
MASNLFSHQILSKSAFVPFGSSFLPKNQAISLNFGSSFSLSKATKSKLRASSGEDLTTPPSREDLTKPPSGEDLTNPLGEELEQKKADEEEELFEAFVDKCIEKLYLPPHYREVKHTQWMYVSREALGALPEVCENKFAFTMEDSEKMERDIAGISFYEIKERKRNDEIHKPLQALITDGLSSMVSNVPIFSGTNFSEWKEKVEFTLGILDLDLDLVFREEEPNPITENSTEEEYDFHKAWEKSNKLSIMFLRMTIANNIKTSLPDADKAKAYLVAIEERFKTAEKSLVGKLMADLTTMKYDGARSMSDHCIEMTNFASKLKNLGMSVDDSFLVQFILNSLPPQYGPFQINYNAIDEKWTSNELANKLVQEEARLGREGIKVVHCVQGAGPKVGKRHEKSHQRAPPKMNDSDQANPKKKAKKNYRCNFCKKVGHFQKDCTKRREWFEKKDNTMGSVSFFESNLTNVSSKAWWIDSGANVHVTNSVQGFLTIQTINSSENYLLMGNRDKAPVEAIGTYRLILDEAFITEVETQLDRKVKIIRSDRGGEFYGRYDETGQHPGPFAKFLQKLGIVAQYSMPGSPWQNGVAERRNRTYITRRTSIKKINSSEKSAISDDYILCQVEFGEWDIKDPVSYSQAMKDVNSDKWIDATKDEIDSMVKNEVWDIVPLPEGHKAVGCKWIFKTKLDCNGNVERYKARLVAKGFNQKEGTDYSETFSPVSRKDSLRIIMALVAHYDLELHQMDVKTAFLNGDLLEEVYMRQPEGFIIESQKDMVCKLKKSIYGLKQASRQWYLKFDETITKFGFKENIVDPCIYLKISGSKFIFLVLYVDDILLASSDLGLLHETMIYLSKNFDMKDMGEASYVIGIEIFRDRSLGILGLSQKAYIDKILERFGMMTCSSINVPMQKGDNLNLKQCPQNEIEHNEMQKYPYASLVGSLMYAQVCTRPDISHAVGMLGRFQSNTGLAHRKATKKVLRYLKGTRNYMLTYRRSTHPQMVGFLDSDFGGCQDSRHCTLGYVYLLNGGAISWKSQKSELIYTSTMEADGVRSGLVHGSLLDRGSPTVARETVPSFCWLRTTVDWILFLTAWRLVFGALASSGSWVLDMWVSPLFEEVNGGSLAGS